MGVTAPGAQPIEPVDAIARSLSPHDLSVDETVALVGADSERGLSGTEAARRLGVHGPNALPPPRRRGPARRMAQQFHNPLIYVLVAATAVTAAIGEVVDASVIGGVVLVNAAIGFTQESRAEGSLRALMSIARTRAVLVRDGRRQVVDSDAVVPGDLVHLGPGDRVPADMRLTWVRGLGVDESMLTGESSPVDKHCETLAPDTIDADRANLAFAGTLVTTGRAEGIAVATGADTALGRIHRLVGETTDLATPLTRTLTAFSTVLTVAIMALAAFTFTLGLVRGEPAADMFTAAVALAVGAIPEGLPAAVTITLAIGVSRMAERRAIVRRLPAAETLGSTTVICSDKTGTLTQNRMVVRAVWAGGERYGVTGEGYAPGGAVRRAGGEPALADGVLGRCLATGVLCNDARLHRDPEHPGVVGDPTEGALLVAAERGGLAAGSLRAAHPRVDVVPFESERGWMATLNAAPEGPVLHVKGAVEAVIARCATMATDDGTVRLEPAPVLGVATELAAEGLRVLALAEGFLPGSTTIDEGDVDGLTLLGLVAMLDPPRPGVSAAIRGCGDAGIAVKMVTGDGIETARAIARRVGLGGGGEPVAVLGSELAAADPQERPDLVDATDVFARVSPEQKLRLVEGLQARGHVVAMTGDGVNDAPALRQADLGIAMGREGTEVAKESADMILADDDFATIAGAVEEGRRVFDNLTKFIVWTLPTNLGEGLVILVAVVLGASLPILPTQILWINMTTAVALGLMLAFERLEDEAMRRPPRDPAQPLLSATLIERIVLVSALLLAGSFGLFELELHLGAPVAEARTVAANVFVVGEAFYLFNCRSLRRSFVSVGVLSNRWLVAGVLITAALQLGFTYLPVMQDLFDTRALGWESWIRILLVGAAVGLAVGAEKMVRRRWHDRAEAPG